LDRAIVLKASSRTPMRSAASKQENHIQKLNQPRRTINRGAFGFPRKGQALSRAGPVASATANEVRIIMNDKRFLGLARHFRKNRPPG